MASQVLNLDLKQAAEWFRRRGRDLSELDFTKPFQAAAVAAAAASKECFQKAAGPDGQPWPPLRFSRPSGGSQPLRDTGMLMASVSARGAKGHIEQYGRNELIFGTNLIEAKIHQYGGTITPKKAKYLSIPLTKEAARAVSPRNFGPDLFVVRSRKGHLLLAQAGQGGHGILPQYLLVKSVTIPARPFLGLSPKLIETVSRIFAEYVAGKINGAES